MAAGTDWLAFGEWQAGFASWIGHGRQGTA